MKRRQIEDGREMWRRLREDPEYVSKVKENFAAFTGEDFAIAPEPLLNTANLLAAIDHDWTVDQFNRIIAEAQTLHVPQAFAVKTIDGNYLPCQMLKEAAE